MAQINAVIQTIPGIIGIGTCWKWSSLVAASLLGDSVVAATAVTSITVLCHGTWNTGTVTIEGSFDRIIWVALNKSTGTTASASSNTFMSLSDLPPFIRPVLSVAGTDNVNVFILAK